MPAAPPSRRQLELRLKACQEALARQPADPQRVLALGSVLRDLGRAEEAAGYFRQAAALELGAGRPQEAARICREILGLLPHDEEARVLLDHLSSEVVVAGADPVVVHGRGEAIPTDDREPTRKAIMPLRPGDRAIEKVRTDVDFIADARPAEPDAVLASVATLTDELSGDPGAAAGRLRRERTSDRSRRMPPLVQEKPKPVERKPKSAEVKPRTVEETTVKTAAPPGPEAERRPRRTTGRGRGQAGAVGAPAVQDRSELAQPSPPAPAPASSPPPAAPVASPATSSRRGPLLPPELIAAGSPQRLTREQFLFREGEPGNELFLLRQGRVELIKWERTPRRSRIDVLEVGACFGELALFGDGRRHLSCRALSEAEVLAIPRQKLREAMTVTPGLERELRSLYRDRLQEILLRTSPLFASLPEEEARASLRRFKPLGLKAEQVVVAEGAPAPGLFIVLLGQLQVSCRPSPMAEPSLLGLLSDGDVFGEISLVRDQPASATVQTRGFVQLLHLALGECHRLLSNRPELLPQLEAEAKKRERVNRAILRGAAYFDEERGAVVYHPRT